MGTPVQRISCLAIQFLVQATLTGIFLAQALVLDSGMGLVTVRLLYYSAISVAICFVIAIASQAASEGLHRLVLITAVATNVSLIGFGLLGGAEHSQALMAAGLYGVFVVLSTPLVIGLAVPFGSLLLGVMYAWLYGREVELASNLPVQVGMGTHLLAVTLALAMRVLFPRLRRTWSELRARAAETPAETPKSATVPEAAG